MATHSTAQPDRRDAERPDAAYALVAGLYVAALLAPAVVAALSAITSNAAALYVGLLGAATGVAVAAGWLVSRIPGLAVDLGRRGASRLLVVVPFVWTAVAFVALAAVGVDIPAAVSLLGIVSAVGGAFLGTTLLAMSRTRHAAVELAAAAELVRWEARWPPRWRRASVGAAVVGVVGGVAGVIARLALGWEWAGSLYYLLFLWTPFAGLATPRTFRATETGLVVERPLQRRFRPWSAFENYELAEGALLVRPAARWRPTHRCDRADVAELDAVLAALERSPLPEAGRR